MQTPLNASASTAGALLSGSTFDVPQFQREYSWGVDEVTEFWQDLRNSLDAASYFLGLVILTEDGQRKHVVDGQQRLITLSLLATAIYHEAMRRDRKALADRIQADFLRSIDYDTDSTDPRVKLSDITDDTTFQTILETGSPPFFSDPDSVSAKMAASFDYLRHQLVKDLAVDPFKRLGKWTDFLTNKLYFAVFVHPDASSAYQVYEVINTRGKELTTADLLKNYVLSQTPPAERGQRYQEWRSLARQFPAEGTNNFVQYIRHVVTVHSGHILPKDLFAFLAQRMDSSAKKPPNALELMGLLHSSLPLYLQMIDQTQPGPANPEQLRIFSALNSLGVIAVRPILLAVADLPDAAEGMRFILQLVVRRIVVGNLGTGNVERRFGEAAKRVRDQRDWRSLKAELADLNPAREDFVGQLKKRSFNKNLLGFIRRSVIQGTMTPEREGVLYFVWTKQAPIGSMGEDEGSFWASTIGNTFLSHLERRPGDIESWEDFKGMMLPSAVGGEAVTEIQKLGDWNGANVESLGASLAERAGEIWY
ncbi:MAG TPA: DUF262 domain-containing protein [Allosphingosinicella sp.]